MKKFLCLFLLMVTSLFSSENKPLTFGTASGYAPFVSLNDKGEYEGFDIDVAYALGQKLSRSIVFKDCGSMPSLMLALKQKKVDALIWGISMTDDRQKRMKMVYYQGEKVDTVPLIFWKEIPKGIETLADLKAEKNKPICVEAGSYQEDLLKTAPNISLKYFNAVNDVILDLKYGKSLASAIDPALVPRFQKKYSDLKVLTLPLPKKMQSQGNGICINSSNSDLAKKVEQAIQELRDEGVIFQLEKKWGLNNDI